MSKFDRRPPKLPDVVANDSIRYSEVRVTAEGEALGILSKAAAIFAAKQRGMDLVLVTENANPPVCKIVDLNKF